MNAYYIANPEHMDAVYGSGEVVCMDAREVRRLAHEWGMDAEDLFAQLHPADADEIAEYGTYTTPLAPEEYAMLFADAARMEDLTFLADWPVSPLGGDPEDMDYIPDDRIAFLRQLHAAAHWSVTEICDQAGITARKLEAITLTPYRTLMRWNAAPEKFFPRDRYLTLSHLGLLPRLE